MNPYLRNPGPPPAARRTARGFTLLELLVVLLIGGILSFYAMGQIANVGEVNAQGFADQLASELRFAQKAAVAQRRSVYVNVTAASNHLYACLDAAVPCLHPLAQPAGGVLDVSGPASVVLTSNVTQFSFNSFGSPSTNAAIQLVATAGDGHQYTITVQPDTGYVQRS